MVLKEKKMKKEFTINVPDELWVDEWNEEKTRTWTYEGTEKLWITVSHRNVIIRVSDEELTNEDLSRAEGFVLELDTEKQPEIALCLLETGEDHEYTYQEETNYDGSVHLQIENYLIRDCFDLIYTPNEGLSLRAIIKESETVNETKAKKRLAYIKKYDDLYDFDNTVQDKIDATIAKLEAYLVKMETARPWKFIKISTDDIPRIPADLMLLFDKLIEIEDI
jgi:hypothetical protein